jgi:hypothetical protein
LIVAATAALWMAAQVVDRLYPNDSEFSVHDSVDCLRQEVHSERRLPLMVENGLLVALFAIVVAAAGVVLCQNVSTLFNTTAGSV